MSYFIKSRKYFVFISFVIACTWSVAWAGSYDQIKVDSKKNCAEESGDSWKENAAKITLPAGRYTFSPIDGAFSKWKSDKRARQWQSPPWQFFVIISAQGNDYFLGIPQKYDTPSEAFSANKNKKVRIQFDKQTTVYFWVEDTYQNRASCDDNRGVMTIGIKKEN